MLLFFIVVEPIVTFLLALTLATSFLRISYKLFTWNPKWLRSIRLHNIIIRLDTITKMSHKLEVPRMGFQSEATDRRSILWNSRAIKFSNLFEDFHMIYNTSLKITLNRESNALFIDFNFKFCTKIMRVFA